jgi:hypothetical protein
MSGKFYAFSYTVVSANCVLVDRVEVSAYSLCHAEMKAERMVLEKLRGVKIDNLTLSLEQVSNC